MAGFGAEPQTNKGASMDFRAINKHLRPLANRVMLMVARGVLRAINDAGGLQIVQTALLEGEMRDEVERMQNYGMTSHPHPGAEAACVFPTGNRDHGLAVAVDDRRYRPKQLAEGEVMVYSSFDQFLHLREDGALEIYAPKGIVLHTEDDQMIKLKAGKIMRHATEYDGADVAGYAEKLWWLEDEGQWWWEYWRNGATFKATVDHGIAPPEVPSEEPDPEWDWETGR